MAAIVSRDNPCAAVPFTSGPLTHEAYASHCRALALAGTVSQARVQVKRQGAVLCGKVLGCYRSSDDGTPLFRVETQLGIGGFTGRNVRLCSGDGRCSCEESA